MQINMTTFARRKTLYLEETLESLFDSDWMQTGATLNLMVGSEDESHVQPYANHPRVRIVPWDRRTNPNMRWNCTLNKIRAVAWGDDETTVTCEDDVLFSPSWFACLQQAAAELEGEEYVLSLFASKPHLEEASLVDGKTWIKEYPMPTLQGAQGLYYPSREIRTKIAAFLKENLREACGDELVGRYARTHAALYATRQILVNHIGQESCFHE